MIIDMLKMFPISCTFLKVDNLTVDTDRILEISFNKKTSPLNYKIRLKNSELYISNMDENIEHLRAICMAEKFLKKSSSHKKIDDEQLFPYNRQEITRKNDLIKDCKIALFEYQIKYGI